MQQGQIPVGRNNIDMIRLNPHPVLDLGNRHGRVALEQLHHHILVGRVQVRDYDEGQTAGGRYILQKQPQRLQSPGRSSDADYREMIVLLRLGFFGFLFLAVLPTTISSAVVLTSLAGGNAVGALVNTTLSNLAGVVLTPFWLGILLGARGESPPVGPLATSIALMILLPFAAGQGLRPLARAFIDRHARGIRDACSGLILFIVYAAFCDSVIPSIREPSGLRSIV